MDFIESKFLMSELVNADQKKIRKALEDAKKQSAIWCKPIARPAVSGDDIIHPRDAQLYLKKCLESVENGLVEMAQRFSPVQWLWYLRRFPYIHDPAEDFSFESYSRTLAAILSARSQRRDKSDQFDTQLSLPLTPSIANHVLAFVTGVYALADLHTHYGAAAREIPFRIRAGHLPDPVLTESKRKAGEIFDTRQAIGSYGLTGTIPSQTELPESSQLLVVARIYEPVATALPYFDLRGLETPFVPTYYLPTQVSLRHISNLYKLTTNGNGSWLNYEVFSLLLLAGLLLPIAASAPEHSINIGMYGYSVHERSDFIMDYWSMFDELVSVVKNLFPGANLPPTPIILLNDLERLQTGTHPLLPNVIMDDKRWIVIDHASVKARLEQLLRFPNAGIRTGKQRGTHFEDAIQSYVDASRWKPSDELRSMRQVHLLRRGDGRNNQITDIDAIGESGDTLLIVSCKAVIFSVGQDIGESDALKKAPLHLDEAVLKWQAVKAELLDAPIGQNYNFNRYSKIIAVVCTPNVVYTESAVSLAHEVGKLRKAATALELIDWLNL